MDPKVFAFFHFLYLLMHTPATAVANSPDGVNHYGGSSALQTFLVALQNGWHFVWTNCQVGPCY